MGEELFLYLAVTLHAVSSALIKEEGKVQKPVYYTSRALKGAEGRISTNRKASFRTYHGFQEAKALLLSPYNQCYDRPLAQESHE